MADIDLEFIKVRSDAMMARGKPDAPFVIDVAAWDAVWRRMEAAEMEVAGFAEQRANWDELVVDSLKLADRRGEELLRVMRDLEACRGALGYSMPGDFDGRLSDGSWPMNGIATALSARLEDARFEQERLRAQVEHLQKQVEHVQAALSAARSLVTGT